MMTIFTQCVTFPIRSICVPPFSSSRDCGEARGGGRSNYQDEVYDDTTENKYEDEVCYGIYDDTTENKYIIIKVL